MAAWVKRTIPNRHVGYAGNKLNRLVEVSLYTVWQGTPDNGDFYISTQQFHGKATHFYLAQYKDVGTGGQAPPPRNPPFFLQIGLYIKGQTQG